jgi:hypothetical protein
MPEIFFQPNHEAFTLYHWNNGGNKPDTILINGRGRMHDSPQILKPDSQEVTFNLKIQFNCFSLNNFGSKSDMNICFLIFFFTNIYLFKLHIRTKDQSETAACLCIFIYIEAPV